MATLDEIGREKQRLADRLARVDADRAKLAQQLEELEIAERVMSRFGMAPPAERRRRGRPARIAPAAGAGDRRQRVMSQAHQRGVIERCHHKGGRGA